MNNIGPSNKSSHRKSYKEYSWGDEQAYNLIRDQILSGYLKEPLHEISLWSKPEKDVFLKQVQERGLDRLVDLFTPREEPEVLAPKTGRLSRTSIGHGEGNTGRHYIAHKLRRIAEARNQDEYQSAVYKKLLRVAERDRNDL